MEENVTLTDSQIREALEEYVINHGLSLCKVTAGHAELEFTKTKSTHPQRLWNWQCEICWACQSEL